MAGHGLRRYYKLIGTVLQSRCHNTRCHNTRCHNTRCHNTRWDNTRWDNPAFSGIASGITPPGYHSVLRWAQVTPVAVAR
jgi:hypothetical protein